MAEIRPFKGLRFASEAGSLDTLTAPPYDVLSPAQRDEYAARNSHNIVHVTLPESNEDDRSKYVKYARSAARVAEWRRDGALQPEEVPALYRYIQTFSIPGCEDKLVRTSVIALIKVEPYDKGVVLPHEQTFPKHKEDRLRILEATRSHLECIFGLYEDPSSEILAALKAAPSAGSFEANSDDGVHQVLEPITDPAAISKIVGLLGDRKVWIADGHHRYETALGFRQSFGEKEGLVAEDFMMMALSSIADPGLVLLPTHRMISKLPFDGAELLSRVSSQFEVIETPAESLIAELESDKEKGVRSFGVVLDGGQAVKLVTKNDNELVGLVEGDGSSALKSLDVTILHSVIFEKLLGIKGLDLISYTRDPEEAIASASNGQVAASFLMIPPSVEDMKVIAGGGEKMPQKSTYYFPKILSGLVLWSLNDYE